VPLTEAALERARGLPDSDPLRRPLSEYLEEHVDEEMGHDDVLLDDLGNLAHSRAAVLGRMPSPAVATLVGCQYYWIHHHHPLAFLGFVAQMEGYPPTPELNELLMARTGYPAEAFQTFIEHARLDPGHRDHLDRTLDSLPLTPEHESMLAVSATTTMTLAALAIEEILDR
jgi:hypothetical protein